MLFALALAWTGGCGGPAATALRPGRPLAPEEGPLFENGVDLVARPEQLSGRWGEDWSRELQGRAEHADVVLRLRIETVRTDIDPDGRRVLRLEGKVGQVLFGTWPEAQDTVTLRVADTEAGFGTVDGRDAQLMGTPFVAFLRLLPSPDGGVRMRWHLSPATGEVMGRLEPLLRARQRPARRRRVAH